MPTITGTVLRNGILVDVSVGISHPLAEDMKRTGELPPVRQLATFVVDTGADRTTVDEQLMRQLGLTPTTQTRVVTLTSGPEGDTADIYAISLQIRNGNPSELPWEERTLRVIGRPLHQGTQGMLGRDVLDRLHLEYNGPIGRFCLRY